ncbi:MAG: hypothetical protein BRD21_05265 [Halobacteriales archaeon SW_8_66_22]|nr:MAG: hypothetical protein BRD21_05265 [Halobacteriales archaeon SW_8_66_22]
MDCPGTVRGHVRLYIGAASQPLVFVMQRRPRAVVADDSHFMRSVITDILEDGGASTDDGATAADDSGGSALATDDRGGVLVHILDVVTL